MPQVTVSYAKKLFVLLPCQPELSYEIFMLMSKDLVAAIRLSYSSILHEYHDEELELIFGSALAEAYTRTMPFPQPEDIGIIQIMTYDLYYNLGQIKLSRRLIQLRDENDKPFLCVELCIELLSPRGESLIHFPNARDMFSMVKWDRLNDVIYRLEYVQPIIESVRWFFSEHLGDDLRESSVAVMSSPVTNCFNVFTRSLSGQNALEHICTIMGTSHEIAYRFRQNMIQHSSHFLMNTHLAPAVAHAA